LIIEIWDLFSNWDLGFASDLELRISNLQKIRQSADFFGVGTTPSRKWVT
jgi:hypothetical protein